MTRLGLSRRDLDDALWAVDWAIAEDPSAFEDENGVYMAPIHLRGDDAPECIVYFTWEEKLVHLRGLRVREDVLGTPPS